MMDYNRTKFHEYTIIGSTVIIGVAESAPQNYQGQKSQYYQG